MLLRQHLMLSLFPMVCHTIKQHVSVHITLHHYYLPSLSICFFFFSTSILSFTLFLNLAFISSPLSTVLHAAILCAGLTSYKALKETESKPGDFVTIIGAGGGLGHLAIQYAKAMGLRVIALDIGENKLKYCESLGAEFSVDAASPDAIKKVRFVQVMVVHNHLYCYHFNFC